MKSNKAPAPNRPRRFPLGASAMFGYHFCAPPAYPAAVGEAQRSPKTAWRLFGDMIKNIGTLAALALLTANCGCERRRAAEIQVVDYGVYTGRVDRVFNVPGSPTGQARTIWTGLAQQTTVIPAVIGTKFGFRFKVVGPSGEAAVVLRLQFTFPEMTNPTTGKAATSYGVSGNVPVGPDIQGIFWDFVHPWEIRPGTWSMQVCSGGRVMAEKTFTVVEGERSGKGESESKQGGEPGGAANRGQPVSSETNRTAAAAGPGG